MTCRHRDGDPDCSSSPEGQARAAREASESRAKTKAKTIKNLENELDRLRKEIGALTPDKMNFDIVGVDQVGPHLVLSVNYPSCKRCSYEGNKVMVFLNTTVKDALFWKELDPHFREPGSNKKESAPAPACRFPASTEGLADALDYAHRKVPTVPDF